MFLSLLYFPSTPLDALEDIRRRYDPTFDLIGAHVPIVFPVPASASEGEITDHIAGILGRSRPFRVRLRGFEKSPDHWLFLRVEDGGSQLIRLFESLYTGPLARFRRHDVDYVPHVGLGLFTKKNATYDMAAIPKVADLDEETYRQALREADAKHIDLVCDVASLDLVAIPDAVLDWARGRRTDFPSNARARTRKKFNLGAAV